MMRVLLIAYSLKGSKDSYTKLFQTIKESGEKWWHFLDSVWLIKTDKSASEVGHALADIVKGNSGDHVFVIEVTGRSQGWLPSKAWEWINENVE